MQIWHLIPWAVSVANLCLAYGVGRRNLVGVNKAWNAVPFALAICDASYLAHKAGSGDELIANASIEIGFVAVVFCLGRRTRAKSERSAHAGKEDQARSSVGL